MKKTCFAVALLMASGSSFGETDKGDGRLDYGHGGANGGNVEVYNKNSTGAYDNRDGEFRFVFGGAPNMGAVYFIHYDGSKWNYRIKIDPDGNLITGGGVEANQIIVKSINKTWPDYVFKEDYKLMSIDDLGEFVKKEGHLPGMPTAAEVNDNGQDIGLVSSKTLEKVEELALYIIQLKQENDALKSEIEAIRSKLH